MSEILVGVSTSSYAQTNREPLDVLIGAGVKVVKNPFGRRLTEDEAATFLADKHGLIAGLEPLNQRVISSAPHLKAIARVGIGMSNIDMKFADKRGIRVSNTPDGPTNAVAELTAGAAIALGRGLVSANSHLHAGEWVKAIGSGLDGRSVLFVGYGRIGRRTAELMSPFGIRVFVVDPVLEQGDLAAGETLVTLDEGLKQADVVSLHASGEEVILGPEQFDIMKRGALLLNSARGELVDENSLLQALDDGVLKGAWFDAFWREPYAGPLLGRNDVILTPHLGTYSEQCRLSMELSAAKNLLNDLGLSA